MPFFRGLPYLAIRKLFHFVDYETRLSLERCSKRTKKLVDAMPFYFELVDISTQPLRIRICEDKGETMTYSNIAGLIYNSVWELCQTLFKWVHENTVVKQLNQLWEIFRNKNIRIKTLFVSLTLLYRDHYELARVSFERIRLVCCLMKIMLGSLDHQLLVENFIIEYNENQDEVMCFLPFLNPQYLKCVKFINCKSRHAPISQIVKAPQVIQCKRVIFDGFTWVPMGFFWHLPGVFLMNTKFDFHETNQLIQVCKHDLNLYDYHFQHYFQHDTFDYFGMKGVKDDWFPDDSNTFIDDRNRKSMIVKGPKFAIKIVQKLEKKTIVLQRIPSTSRNF
ncbi:hypothetical protein CRE_08963 [Caenorhabditis remanei]|uniref:F-box domain-containing protein n=1 Tax=Caenorhabditis remanei TaxID=31234 RepID=E3LIH8_CAERE|nr:hypothetical protein CRE_08963 [Caenorhabditis remanei]